MKKPTKAELAFSIQDASGEINNGILRIKPSELNTDTMTAALVFINRAKDILGIKKRIKIKKNFPLTPKRELE
jgi:hypothetical protein